MTTSVSSELERSRYDSLLQKVFSPFRSNITTANLVGLMGVVFTLLLLLVLPAPWNIRLPLYIGILIWTLLRPRVALYLLPLAVPWGSLDTLPIGGLRLNSADILVVFLVVGWLMSFALRPAIFQHRGPRDREVLNTPRYLILAMLALLGTMLLSMTGAFNLSSSLKEISKWLEFLALLLLGTQYIRTRRQLWILIIMICLGGISQALFGYIQYFYNLGPSAFVRDANLRVYGTFEQPNPYAGYINIPLSIALALMLLGRRWLTRISAGLTTLLLGAAEYLAQSRGGEIAIAVVVLLVVLVGMPRVRPLLGLLIIGGIGMLELFLAGVLPSTILTPVLRILGLTSFSFTAPSNEDFSTAERLAHWIAGIRMFVDQPFLGVGIGNYPDAYPQYFITIFVNPLGHAHNYYINIAAETGSIGLTAYLLFLFAIFVAGISAYRYVGKQYDQAKVEASTSQPKMLAPPGTEQKRRLLLRPGRLLQYYRQQGKQAVLGKLTNDRALAIGLLAALVSVSVHNLVDDLYVHSLTNLFALLLITLIRLEGVTPKFGDNGG